MTQKLTKRIIELIHGEEYVKKDEKCTCDEVWCVCFNDRMVYDENMVVSITLSMLLQALQKKCKNMVAFKIHDNGDTFIYFDNITIRGWELGKNLDQQSKKVQDDLWKLIETL